MAATGWSGLGVLISGLVRFTYSALVGHLGGALALGTVNSAISLALLAGLAGPNAVGAAASKFIARSLGAGDPASARATWRVLARWGALLAVACSLVAAVVGVVVLRRGLVQGAVIGVLVLALAAYTLARGARFGAGDFARTAAAEAVAAVLALGLLVVVLATGQRWLALVPLAVGYLAYTALTWPRTDAGRTSTHGTGTPGITPAAPASGEVRAFVGWAVLGGVASAGLLQLSVVVAAVGDTRVHAGWYAAAVAVGTPMALLAVPLSQALFSLLSRASGGGDAEGVRRRTDVATRALVVLMVAVGGGLALVSRTALAVVGPGLAGAVPLLQALAVAVLVSTLTMPAVASLTSGSPRGMRQVALMSGSGLVVGLAVMAVAVPRAGLGLGVRGVAAGYVAGTLVTNVLPWCVAWRRHHLAWTGVSVRVVIALAVLVVLLHLPWAATYTGGWVLGVAFAGAWLALSVPQVRRLLPARAAPRNPRVIMGSRHL